MEELYIKIENGKPVGHPFLGSNLLGVFGKIPQDFEPFRRVEDVTSDLKLHQKVVTEYKKVDGLWTDTFVVVAMSEEEKLAQNERMVELKANYEAALIASGVQQQPLVDKDGNAVTINSSGTKPKVIG